MRNGEARQLSLYIDGLLVASGEELGTGKLRSEGPLRIGRSDGDDFNGTIDEVRIFNRILSKEEMQPLHQKPKDGSGERRTANKTLPPIRAEGVTVMRKRLESWKPTLTAAETISCAIRESDMLLKNDWMEINLSRETGEITALVSRGKQLLCAPGGVSIRDMVADVEFIQTEGKVTRIDVEYNSFNEVTVSFRKQYDNKYTATITYKLGVQALCCDVRLETDLSEPREARIEFNLPMLSNMTKAFWTRENAPFDMSDLPAELLVYRNSGMNTLMVLPSLTVYNPDDGVGLSLVAPFDLPKPGLYFKINTGEKRVQVSNIHLRLAKEEAARAAVYIVPHEGCWRPALAWMVKTYPDYFYPGNRKGIETPGWYFLGGPHGSEADMQTLKDRGCKWYQIHSHFPFYGLYMPKTDSWDVVVGLADQGKANLSDWEAGKEQGGYPNSYDQMREAIALRQKYDMQPLLYFQSFELWEQYGEKYCVEDVARGKNGRPHGAWYHCNLMNPDPAFAWGKDITAQIKRVPEEYPEIDGIFYDRDDYKEYDYAHDDGITMDVDVPCYPLCFAQQQINDVITGVLRDHDMTIITNGPTSVEVCKYIDGIMAETNAWGASLQYLGLVRPMTLLPYFFETNTYDQSPVQAEYKLKMALCGGFYPSLTYGEEDSQRIDQQYRPLFDLMKDREWVLNANALTLDEGMSGNIFRSSEGHYLATVVDFKRSKVEGDSPVRDVKVAIQVPDASDINYCYVLSGDYAGPVAVPITREQDTIQVIIPVHLASSMAVFTKEPLFEVARSSMPLFTKREREYLIS